MKHPKVKTKKDIQSHPGVASIHKEDDGCYNTPSWWVYLKEGWISPEMECGIIHERTIKDICDKVNYIIKKATK